MRVLIGAVSLVLIPAGALVFWDAFRALVEHGPRLWIMIPGLIAGMLIDQVVFRRHPRMNTFEHELTHALVALLFLRGVNRFVVTDRGGMVSHTGGFGGTFADDHIGFAPYYLPTFTLLGVLVRPWVPAAGLQYFDFGIAATLGFHVWSTVNETSRSWTSRRFQLAGTGEWTQSDIGSRGFVYSFLFIASMSLLTHALVFAIWLKGYAGVGWWWRRLMVYVEQGWSRFWPRFVEYVNGIM